MTSPLRPVEIEGHSENDGGGTSTTGQRSRKPVDCGRAGQAQSPGQIGATGERRRALFFMQCHETENDGHWDRLHDAKSIVPAPAKIFKDMAPFT